MQVSAKINTGQTAQASASITWAGYTNFLPYYQTVFDLGAYGIGPWGTTWSSYPHTNSRWIWNTAAAASAAVSFMTIRFSQIYSVSSAYTATIYVTCDNQAQIYVNGKNLSGFTSVSNQQITYTFQAGTNAIDILGMNVGTSENPAGLICTIVNQANGQVMGQTDSSWVWYWYNGLGDPDGFPWGWGGGQVNTWTLEQCATNAMAAGAITMMSTANYKNLSTTGRCNYYNQQPGPRGLITKVQGGIGWAFQESDINRAPIVYNPYRYIQFYVNGSNVSASTSIKNVIMNYARFTNTGDYNITDFKFATAINTYGSSSIISGSISDLITNSGNPLVFSGGANVLFDYGSSVSNSTGIMFSMGDANLYNNVTVSISNDGSTWTTIYGPVNTSVSGYYSIRAL